MNNLPVIILNTISKRQDGSDLFRILHTKSFSKFTEALSTHHSMCITWYNITVDQILEKSDVHTALWNYIPAV